MTSSLKEHQHTIHPSNKSLLLDSAAAAVAANVLEELRCLEYEDDGGLKVEDPAFADGEDKRLGRAEGARYWRR